MKIKQNYLQKELLRLFEAKFGEVVNGSYTGYLDLRQYNHALPNSIVTTGDLDMRQYNHALPNSIVTTGYLYLSGYNHALPNSIVTTGKLYMRQYNHALPNSIVTTGDLDLGEDRTLKIGKHKLTLKNIDGTCFVVEKERTSRGIKIYTGYNFVSMTKNVIEKQPCFVAEKDGFFAHGEDVRKAIGDLNFKIVSEKLKKEPIDADTLLTVKHYRLITGSCDMGCRNFMKKNGLEYKVVDNETVEVNPIKAKDLLPLLKKNNAYGLEKFVDLITF